MNTIELEFAEEQFIEGFMASSGLSREEAQDHWVAFSRQLTNADRREVESGGYETGLTNGWLWNNL